MEPLLLVGAFAIVALGASLLVLSQRGEYSVRLPQRFNDGSPVPPEVRQRLEDMLRQVFKGFTALRGLDGSWVAEDGRDYPDVIDEYRLAARRRGQVLAFAREAGRLLDQRAVYVRCPSDRVMIVRVDRR